MQFDNLYRTLVVGGAVLVSACASTSKQVSTSESGANPGPDDADGDTTATDISPDEERTEEASPEETVPEAPFEINEELACEDVCSGGSGREMICPDPDIGAENCCWLMSNPHPCCP